jgi:hypothetical protein
MMIFIIILLLKGSAWTSQSKSNFYVDGYIEFERINIQIDSQKRKNVKQLCFMIIVYKKEHDLPILFV